MKKERSFELGLPAIVAGTNAMKKAFEEQTRLISISAEEANFPLRSPVLIGTKLRLVMDIPGTLILEKQLQLSLSGIVVFVETRNPKGKTHLVSLHLDRSFRLQPSSPS